MIKLILFILVGINAHAQTCSQQTFYAGTIPQTTVQTGSAFQVTCNYGAPTTNTDALRVDYPTCHFASWSGSIATFNCMAESYSASYPFSCLLVKQFPNNFCPMANYIGSVQFSTLPFPTPGPTPTPSPAAFAVGQAVTLIGIGIGAQAVIRATPLCSSPNPPITGIDPQGFESPGATGVIAAGPIMDQNGNTWYEVKFSDGLTGWDLQAFFQAIN